jgi:hypothetical protein
MDKSLDKLVVFSLKTRFDEKRIVIPSFQREEVWTKSQKQLLIDSILRDFDIPKIYLKVDKDKSESSNETLSVIDGQQRISSIMGFLRDEFSLSKDADPIFGEKIAGKFFSNLSDRLRDQLQGYSIDVVKLKNYDAEEIEEMFSRLQNGTQLNAAEKRRALNSNLREVVSDLSKHKVFASSVGFTSKRFGYEDAVAKVLHFHIRGGISLISQSAIVKTYSEFEESSLDPAIQNEVRKSFSFIDKAFKNNTNPKLKKGIFITISYVVGYLLKTYDLSNYHDEFAEAYLDFETLRIENREKSEEEQDGKLTAFTDALRSDDVASMDYRHRTLIEEIITRISNLKTLDGQRNFTQDQRVVIYHKFGKKCAICGTTVEQDNFHVDHIIPFSKGGKTTVDNGQLSCPSCNLAKSNKI